MQMKNEKLKMKNLIYPHPRPLYRGERGVRDAIIIAPGLHPGLLTWHPYGVLANYTFQKVKLITKLNNK